jgi:threonine dehydratase
MADAREASPDFAAVRAAHDRVRDRIHRTPVMTSRSLDERVGARLYFKCENFQKVGAFKARGAANAVFSLAPEVAARGVVTHSSGNHGAALAWAARERGVPSYIVMPSNAPRIKQANVRGFGAEVIFCEPNVAAREAACREVQQRTGAELVHPYNDERVIAGQGTAALELLAEVPDLDVVIAPVGGGGLLSGTAIAVKSLRPRTRVIGAEPAHADDAFRSFRSGRIEPLPATQTIADGLRTTLGDRTLPLIRAYVDDVQTCAEETIVEAMRFTWERMKIIIEPSGAVSFAMLLERRIDVSGLKVGVVISGGNVDLDRLPWQ